MKKFKYLLIGLISLSLFSCVNEEGEGGTAVVQGKVFKVLHSNDDLPLVAGTDTVIPADTFPAAKEDVYIVYGDQPIYGDKMETGYDGFYRFKYLVKGKYKVFAYSSLANSTKQAVIDSVTVKSGQVGQVSNIYVHEGKSYQTSYIKGTVMARYYDKLTPITGLVPACDVRVFVRHKGAVAHFDEARTGAAGEFLFQGLTPGDYEVFVMTEKPNQQVLSPVIQSVTVGKVGEIKVIKDPFQIILNA